MWAEFTERFYYDRRPKQAVAFVIEPGKRNVQRDIAAAAFSAGKAMAMASPKRTTKQKSKTSAA